MSRRGDGPDSGEQPRLGIGGQFSKRYPAFFMVGVSQAFGLVMMLFVATLTGAWSTPLDYLPSTYSWLWEGSRRVLHEHATIRG
ncbi:MAG: hypothetical protein R2686_03195 [Candidatus Nanopelagicales bacterium]